MILALISILGLFFGLAVAYYTKEELKQGKKYFIILEFLILIVLFLLTTRYNFSILFLVVGIILGIIIRNPYLFFGILLGGIADINFLHSILVFVYGLADGSLILFDKKEKYLYWSIGLFFVQLLLYYLGITLINIVNGGLIGVTLYRIYDDIILKQLE